MRDPVPLARRRRHGGFHPRASACAWCRRAISSAGSRRPGTRPRSRRIARPPRSSIASRIARSSTSARSSSAGDARPRVRSAAADGARGSREEGLVADAPPIVGAQENAGNPHYAPTRDTSRPIRPNELLLLDLWGKLETARRGLRRHHLDRVRRRPARRNRRGVRRRSSPAATRPSRRCSRPSPPDSPCTAGRSIGPPAT